MKKAKKIKKAERDEIFILLDKGYSIRSIGRALGRSPNSISYEVRNNSVNGTYNQEKAEKKARRSLRNRRFQWRIALDMVTMRKMLSFQVKMVVVL